MDFALTGKFSHLFLGSFDHDGDKDFHGWDYAFFCLVLTYLSVCAFLFFPVKFIDFKIGEDSGYVRFEDPEAAQKARAAAVLAEQGGLLVKNYIATLEPVAGRQQLLSSYFFRLFGSSVLHDD